MVRTVVPAGLDTPSPLDVSEAHELIAAGGVEVFTTDVFDTLVWRPVAAPDHLFVVLGQHLIDAGHIPIWVDLTTFAETRRQAERSARQVNFERKSTYECTLEEIWDQMPADWWCGGAEAGTGVAAELAIESEQLHLQPAGMRLLEAARAAGCRVELVSDTYLTVEQLRAVLSHVGIDLAGVGVHTSCSVDRGKWEGLLADVVGKTTIEAGPQRWLHVGDNMMADVIAAETQGGTACWFEVSTPDDWLSRTEANWHRLSFATGCDGGRQAVLHETLVAAGDAADDVSYQFGAGVAGPMLAGFAGWAGLRTEQLGATRVHCLLREGARIAELMQLVRPNGPPTQLVHASRWAMMRAAIVDGTPEQIARALGRRGPITTELIETAFDVPEADVRRVLGGDVFNQTERAAIGAALAEDDATRDQIVTRAKQLRTNVERYFDQTLRPDDGPLVLCDIGWGGSIQEAITEILRARGDEVHVVGLYLLLSPAAFERQARGAHLEAYLPNVGPTGSSMGSAAMAMRNPEFLERITTPEVGTLLEFDDRGEPLCRPDADAKIGGSLANGQQGVVDFCRHLGEMATPTPALADFWFADRRTAETALTTFANTISVPDERLRSAIGSWEHDDLAGAEPESLTNPRFVRWARFLTTDQAREVPMTDTYWVNGALPNDINAHLRLIGEGVDPNMFRTDMSTDTSRLSVFSPGSELAHSQFQTVLATNPHGWMVHSFEEEFEPAVPLRSLRFDPAERDAFVEIGDVHIVLETHAGEATIADGVDGWFDAGTWVDGRAFDASHVLTGTGGHFVMNLDPDALGPITGIRARVAFRTVGLPEGAFEALGRDWAETGRRLLRNAPRATAARIGRVSRRVRTR